MNSDVKEAGTRQLVWLPNDLFDLTEIVRKKFGMSRSAFYRYAVTALLQELSILSTKAKEGLIKETGSNQTYTDFPNRNQTRKVPTKN